MSYLLERLEEPSTWRGITLLMTAFAVKLSPEQIEAIVAAGMALSGAIGVFAKGK